VPSTARAIFPKLSLRELNRALLARQMLLGRKKVGVVDAIASITRTSRAAA
jgi:hypothetical protein